MMVQLIFAWICVSLVNFNSIQFSFICIELLTVYFIGMSKVRIYIIHFKVEMYIPNNYTRDDSGEENLLEKI